MYISVQNFRSRRKNENRQKKAEDDFEVFLTIMDDQIEGLKEDAEKRSIYLDDSIDDGEKLENLFDSMAADLSENEKKGLIVLFARHLGEIMRLNYGGSWHLSIEDEKNVYFNTPVIREHSSIKGLEFSPLFPIRSYALRKKKGTLRTAIMAHVAPKELNIDHLLEP
jgi:hypothetical protein